MLTGCASREKGLSLAENFLVFEDEKFYLFKDGISENKDAPEFRVYSHKGGVFLGLKVKFSTGGSR